MTRYDFMGPHEIITRHTRPTGTRARRTAPLLSMAEKVVVTLRDCDKSHEHLITFSTYTLNRACIADSIEV